MEKITRIFYSKPSTSPRWGVQQAREFHVELVDYYPRLKDWYLTAEPETYDWLVNNARADWTCIEVGAHVGEVSLLLSQLCSRVIAFEPNPESVAKMRRNIAHNQLTGNFHFLNIDLVERAVGNTDGIMGEKLWLTGKDDQFGETFGEFDFLTLDRFVRVRDDIERVALVFIDADGWDYDVLLGAESLVVKCHPYIILEANYALAWRGHTLNDIYNWAAQHKYDCSFLDAKCPGNMLLIPATDYVWSVHEGEGDVRGTR